jgi:Flp pilus assembly protein TadB
MSGIRIIAILVAIAIAFTLEYWLGTPWYVAFPLGVMGYLLTRYVGWVITERRRLERETDKLLEKVKRGEPLD